MAFDCKIIKDSISTDDVRLTTFAVCYPRCIHSEFMTHRLFSRNASSSRAVPVKKMIQQVIDDPYIPIEWGLNQSGMQAGELLSDREQERAKIQWLWGRDAAVSTANNLLDSDVHKQHVNRVLEPYAWISVIITATNFANFFKQRCSDMAQPEICKIASMMYRDMMISTPQVLGEGEWHLPYVTDDEFYTYSMSVLLKISTARCARVSYLNHDGSKADVDKDVALYDGKLIAGGHMSPTEHQAYVAPYPTMKSGNFTGWIQYRKTFPDECVTQIPDAADLFLWED